ADLWSLGVVVYELYVGKTPFRTNSLADLKRNIMEEDIVWPKEIPRLLKDFLQGLLQRDPADRMHWSQLRRHPFLYSTGTERPSQAADSLRSSTSTLE
ncbi:Serine/threonine-protein kinase 36, partial [Coemansia biformis]